MPERFRLRRTRGWRKPPGAVVVARPGRWGNPYPLAEARAEAPDADDAQLREIVVGRFRELVAGERDDADYPSRAEIRAALAGKDLGCWCPLGGACHGDVLLEIANAPHGDGAPEG